MKAFKDFSIEDWRAFWDANKEYKSIYLELDSGLRIKKNRPLPGAA